MKIQIYIDDKKLPTQSTTDSRWGRLKDDILWMTKDSTVMSCACGDGSYRIIRMPDMDPDELIEWNALSKDLIDGA